MRIQDTAGLFAEHIVVSWETWPRNVVFYATLTRILSARKKNTIRDLPADLPADPQSKFAQKVPREAVPLRPQPKMAQMYFALPANYPRDAASRGQEKWPAAAPEAPMTSLMCTAFFNCFLQCVFFLVGS